MRKGIFWNSRKKWAKCAFYKTSCTALHFPAVPFLWRIFSWESLYVKFQTRNSGKKRYFPKFIFFCVQLTIFWLIFTCANFLLEFLPAQILCAFTNLRKVLWKREFCAQIVRVNLQSENKLRKRHFLPRSQIFRLNFYLHKFCAWGIYLINLWFCFEFVRVFKKGQIFYEIVARKLVDYSW